MLWCDNSRVAASGLWANRLRSGLTMLGLIIGISAVILVVSLGIGIQKYLKEQLKTWGPDVIGIAEQQGQRTFRPLTMADVEALRTQVNVAQRVSPVLRQDNARVSWQSINTTGTIQGVTPEVALMLGIPIVQGRFITQRELEDRAKVAVLGNELAKEIFKDEDPIGKQLLISSQQAVSAKDAGSQASSKVFSKTKTKPKIIGSSQLLTVIGVTKEGAFEGHLSLSRGLLIPLTMAQELLIPSESPFGRKVSNILLEAKDGETIEQVTFQTTNVMRQRHQITTQDDFTTVNYQEQLNLFNNVAKGMTIFLGVVAAISLLVGGINIMNIMLVSVKERTPEIGLRKALGASEEVILTQFVIEALFIAVVGGLIGIGIGFGLVTLVATFTPLKAEVTPFAMILAVGVSGGIGLFFGVFPARQAANLDPITALRKE
jgi:putative ABC transport system permease protein